MVDILLVEDYAELNELMRTFLEREGYLVKGVFSGRKHWNFWQQKRRSW